MSCQGVPASAQFATTHWSVVLAAGERELPQAARRWKSSAALTGIRLYVPCGARETARKMADLRRIFCPAPGEKLFAKADATAAVPHLPAGIGENFLTTNGKGGSLKTWWRCGVCFIGATSLRTVMQRTGQRIQSGRPL